ncbi:nucleoporin Nup188p [[Candida] anglica]|uniref:Nucleoporin NUP188 n=1 Tax=[Candida] anglica TaxID=148631 RepID=A0ABP0EPC8_9ASCO
MVGSKQRAIVPLKPIEPSQLWTFENALSLLKTCKDQYILEALDEFLLNNKSVLLKPLPFTKKESVISSPSKEVKPVKDLSLRNVLYSDINTTNNSDAHKISDLVSLEFDEVLRTISQTCRRVPERRVWDTSKLKSKLPDDRERQLEEDRLVLYTSGILRDRRVVLKIVAELLSNKTNHGKSLTVQNLGKEIFLSKSYIERLINALQVLTESLSSGSYKTGLSDRLDQVIYNETVLIVTELMKVLVEILYSTNEHSKKTVQQWFIFMNSNNFILSLGPFIEHSEPFILMQALSTIISIILLDLDNNFGDNFSNTDNFMNDVSIFKNINDCITKKTNSNSVIMYSWSILLYRKSVIMSEYKTEPSIQQFNTSFASLDPLINILNSRCLELDVFQDLVTLNKHLAFDELHAAVLSTVIIAAMPLINMSTKNSCAIVSVLKEAPLSTVEKFFSNESAIEAIILARAKFPLSITPYLKLASINGNFALNEFRNLKSYMSLFQREEFTSISQIDDENTDLVKLTKLIDVYPPYENNKKLSLLLQEDTKAKVLPSAHENEVLVTFLYKYNGWAFLGRILQNVVKSFNNFETGKVEFIITLLELLTSVVRDNGNEEDTKEVLESMSLYIDDSDVLEVIFRLFEQNLHSRNIEVLVAVCNLLTELTPMLSHRIWPSLSKSALLSSDGKEGFAATIFGAIEMINGDYSFTISLIHLVSSLIENSISLDEEYNQRTKSILLTRWIDYLILIFESFAHCRFNNAYQKLEIGSLVLDIFSTILTVVYSVDENSNASDKVTKVFAESSTNILDSFLISGSEDSRISLPLLSMIESIGDNFSLYEARDLSGYWFDKWVRASLSFSSLIISIRSMLKRSPSTFEISIFSKLPNLVEVYSLHDDLRKPVLDLITTLTNADWGKSSTPSLLSHLGRDHSQVLLSSLIADLENSFDDYNMKISLYNFICAVMDGKQEGLSMLFISGRDVYGEVNKSENKKSESEKTTKKTQPLLSVLKKNLREMKYYPNYVSLHLADAISLAFNSWTIVRGNDDDIEFIDILISKFQQPQNAKATTSEEYIEKCYELKLLAKIAEILSLFVFTSNNETCNNKIIKLLSSEDFRYEFLRRFDTMGYNQTLSSDLERNFLETYSCDISKFSSSLVKRNYFDDSTVYNLSLMEKIYSKDISWPTIREQVKACNVNIQYVTAQIAVVKSHGALLTAFCKVFGSKLTSDWVFLASQLLFFDVLVDIPSEIFTQVYRERIELSFFMLYTMSINPEIKVDTENVLEVIRFTSQLLSSASVDFIHSLTMGGDGCYKSLLRILYLSINMIKEDTEMLVNNLSIFRNLFELVFARGTKNLLVELQNDVYLSCTDKKYTPTNLNLKFENLTLILSILKVFVELKAPASLQVDMASIVKSHGTIKSLLNLYSCSHLIKTNGELVFAKLSLMFIQELSVVDTIAQEFISSGLYVVLTGSIVSGPIQAGNLSVSNSPNTYSIWTNGLLPLVLTSFAKIGPEILPEICIFLRAFGKQVETCIQSWSKDSSSIQVSSAMIWETRHILEMYEMLKAANITEFLGDKNSELEITPETVDMVLLPGLDSEVKREDFIENISNLLKHPKFLSSRVIASSVDEQRLIENSGSSYSQFVKSLIDEIRELKEYFRQ